MDLILNSFILIFTTHDRPRPVLWRGITVISSLLRGFERGRLIISSITSLLPGSSESRPSPAPCRHRLTGCLHRRRCGGLCTRICSSAKPRVVQTRLRAVAAERKGGRKEGGGWERERDNVMISGSHDIIDNYIRNTSNLWFSLWYHTPVIN